LRISLDSNAVILRQAVMHMQDGTAVGSRRPLMRCKCSQMVDPNNHWEPNALAGPDRTDSLDWPADMLSVRPCHEAVRTSTFPAGCKRMAKMPI